MEDLLRTVYILSVGCLVIASIAPIYSSNFQQILFFAGFLPNVLVSQTCLFILHP